MDTNTSTFNPLLNGTLYEDITRVCVRALVPACVLHACLRACHVFSKQAINVLFRALIYSPTFNCLVLPITDIHFALYLHKLTVKLVFHNVILKVRGAVILNIDICKVATLTRIHISSDLDINNHAIVKPGAQLS